MPTTAPPETEPETEPAAPPTPPPDQPKAPPTTPEPEDQAAATTALEHFVAAPAEVMPSWKEMQGLAAMAVTLSAANAVPVALRGRPNDVFLVLLTARELGVAPTAALRTCYVVNGAVTLAPKLRAAMVRQQHLGRIWPDPGNNREAATWHATRADEDHAATYSYTFTLDDALAVPEKVNQKMATLADKDNWKAYPQRMLSWRALGYLLDDIFPEVGTGLYSADEVGSTTDDEGNPVIRVDATDPLPGTEAPRGHHGSTPPPPNPADEPMDGELAHTLAERIAVLARVPGAKAALVELWTQPREGGDPLPHFADLRRRHRARAEAMVLSVEARLKKGEWGDPPEPEPEPTDAGDGPDPDPEGEQPDDPGRPFEPGPTQAPVPPQAAQDGPAAPEGTDTPPAPETAADGPHSAPPEPMPWDDLPPMDEDARKAAIVLHANSLATEALSAALEAEGLAVGGTEKARRQRLANALVAKGWRPGQD